MAKRILVPTDFSDVAMNALRYAGQFAVATDISRIDLVHWYTPQTASDALLIPPIKEILDQRRESIQHFTQRSDLPSAITVKASVEVGFAADEIVQESDRYDWVIMGATGSGGILEQVFGSVSSSVAQRAHCPVLLVPGTAIFKDYRQILYASSDIAVSQEVVGKLMDFNHLFHARVHFIHVREEGDEPRNAKEREQLFASLFSGPDPDFAFEIGDVSAESIEKGLRQYLADHPIDLVVMATKRRGFWENFFHRSQVRQMALHPDLPLLVFHLSA